MSCSILIVDDMPSNILLLKAKLERNFFQVISANNGVEAIKLTKAHMPDIILLDIMMPLMDGYEVCKRLKADELTRHIPIVMITSLDKPKDKIKGLKVMADDFINKPFNETTLVARIKNLTRWKMMTDELRLRYETGKNLGAIQDNLEANTTFDTSNVALVSVDDNNKNIIITSNLSLNISNLLIDDCDIIEQLNKNNVHLLIIDLDNNSLKNLGIISKLRAIMKFRSLPILGLLNSINENLISKALELGINDIIFKPIDTSELLARIRTLLQYKHDFDHLTLSFEKGLELAVKDRLTGLNNRVFFEKHLQSCYQNSIASGKNFCILIADIDFFKKVNDNYGHLAGDKILIDFSNELVKNMRHIDLICRFGGEEFIIIMPDTSINEANKIAKRLRKIIEKTSFSLPDQNKEINITASIGLSCFNPIKNINMPTDDIIENADKALYLAKESGRNQVKTLSEL